jgi:hypothetical protein
MTATLTRLTIPSLLVAVFVTAGSAWANDMPLQCITDGGRWEITATSPQVVDCGQDCGDGIADGMACTAMTYTIHPLSGITPDHVSILVTHDMVVKQPSANNIFDPCEGDAVTELGLHDCASQAVRINPAQGTEQTQLCVEGGEWGPTTSSIVVKKGRNTIEQCRIAALGTDFFVDPNAQGSMSQTYEFKGCSVTIPTNPVSGDGGIATISGGNCKFLGTGVDPNPGLPVAAARLNVNGVDVGAGTYGVGALSSNTNSCSTNVVRRKIYTFCTCAIDTATGCTQDPCEVCGADSCVQTSKCQ